MNTTTETLHEMRDYFDGGETKNLKFRIDALRKLKEAILQNEKRIFEALHKDLAKHEFEAYATEVGIVLHEISYTLKHLKSWARRKKVKTPLMHVIAKSRIYSEPYGVTLIMSPWNYPFQLALVPLVGAVAAGNCVVLKPSDYSKNTSAIIYEILSGIFPARFIKVLTGGREVNKSLLCEKFDYIFFTGSTTVGHAVMEAAAKNLTPVTLELGGKSPCIVDETANVDLAAKRIVWGKFINAGQTCVAPDYVYVHKSIRENFIESLKKYIVQFFGDEPEKNPDFPKIINEKHFNRVSEFLKCGQVMAGGKTDKEKNRIAPTILYNITWDDAVMKEEIFGPVLPVMEFESLDEVIAVIRTKPRPLALYLFTTSKAYEKKLLNSISFGGGCVNDAVVHLATSYMPFGGVGDSGMGGYHGKASFDTFSHKKSILKKSNMLDINIRYAPYKKSIKILKMFLK